MSSYTRGPWRWFVNVKARTCYLATVDRGRQFVLDAVRWGTQQATMRFQGSGTMLRAELLDKIGPDHNGEVKINHPDAKLIAQAPMMAEMLLDLAQTLPKDRADENALYHKFRDQAFELLKQAGIEA